MAPPRWRSSWKSQASTLYGVPLEMRYEGLNPRLRYTLRAVYTGRFKAKMRLEAGGILVHQPLRGPDPPEVLRFEIPPEATSSGTLHLKWTCAEGRGCQVAEVWLEPEPAESTF